MTWGANWFCFACCVRIADDLATVSSYIAHSIRRFGDWVLGLVPADAQSQTRLVLVPRAVFTNPSADRPNLVTQSYEDWR
jgi:hypothetical protein